MQTTRNPKREGAFDSNTKASPMVKIIIKCIIIIMNDEIVLVHCIFLSFVIIVSQKLTGKRKATIKVSLKDDHPFKDQSYNQNKS